VSFKTIGGGLFRNCGTEPQCCADIRLEHWGQRGLLFMGMVLALFVVPLIASAQQLTAFRISAKGHNAEVVTMQFSGRAPRPSIFSIDAPAQLTVDLPGVSNSTSNLDQSSGHGLIKSVQTGSVKHGLRLAFKLRHNVPYHLERSGHRLRLFLNVKPNRPRQVNGMSVTRLGQTQPSSGSQSTISGAHSHSQSSGPRHVTHIDFRRGPNDAGRVVLKLSRANAPVSVYRKDGQVIATIGHTQLPQRLQKHLDVRDFGSIVKGIDVKRQHASVRVVINPRQGADFSQLAYETGQKVNIELKPRGAGHKSGKKSNKPKYTGKKISLSFQNIQVRKLLQIIASVADVNLITSGQVSGTTSLRLQHVPWDQALHIILRSQGLGKRKNGNVITIAPLSQMAARDKAQKAANQATESLKPIRTQIIRLNYATASNIKKLIKAGKGGGTGSLLSKRGQIEVDKRTNSLIINATQSHIDAIQKLVNKLDKSQQQVLIEARIVVANRNFQRELGSKFNVRGANQKAGTGPGGNQLVSGASNSANQINSGGFSTSLPVSGATSQLATSIITGHMNIGLVLQALQSENEGKVVSSPRVITANDQKASVSRGTQIPYIRSSRGSLAGSRVSFKKAQLKLSVTPRITPDGHVQMDLDIKKDSIGSNVPTASGNSAPAINTNELKTKVLVNNGNTVVLGGIYKHTNTKNTSGVPYFDKIPLLGRLFKMTNRTNNRRQLLIFITPRILNSQVRATANN